VRTAAGRRTGRRARIRTPLSTRQLEPASLLTTFQVSASDPADQLQYTGDFGDGSPLQHDADASHLLPTG